MAYLFSALATFWILRLLQSLIEAPSRLWIAVLPVVSCLFLLPWDTGLGWYAPFVVAGIVSLLQLVENFLIAKSDEALTSIMRRR
jgi:asparagine N-glycosylation enzyme membrane subunit Stt3